MNITEETNVWEVLEAIFHSNGGWREEDPTPHYLLLKACGLIHQTPDSFWHFTDEGHRLRDMKFGPASVLDLEDYQETDDKLEKASADCRRLANLVTLMCRNADDQMRHVVVISAPGLEIVLGDIIDGYMALHDYGEGAWW